MSPSGNRRLLRTEPAELPCRQCTTLSSSESKKPIAMDGLGSMWAIWSGKRGSNSRPIPWQGIALPTELFPRLNQRKTHHKDGFINLVAWGGIEPPTQGFSIQRTRTSGVSVSRRNVTSFPGFGGWPSPSTEPAAEPFRALGLHGHRFFRMESTQ